MNPKPERLHVRVTGESPRELGLSRGAQLRSRIAEAYDMYSQLFRAAEITPALEAEAVAMTLDTLRAWRPGVVAELEGIAEGAEVPLASVVALNARTEIMALGVMAAKECTTIAARVGDGSDRVRLMGVQTWDWHVELDALWHTQEVVGPGYRFAGLTEIGLLSKIGLNSAGLAQHMNFLGHEEDQPGGVPAHILSAVVLSECATVEEAIELIRSSPIRASVSLTLIDADRAVSVELSPRGIFEVPLSDGVVVRTNSFLTEVPLAGQKSVFGPDSLARLDLVRSRLDQRGLPADEVDLVGFLESTADEAPLSCKPDMGKKFGERWATLATCVTDPEAGTIRILDGMPTEAGTARWYDFTP